MTEFTSVAVASRAFSLAAIIGLAVGLGEASALGTTAVVMGLAAVASYVSLTGAAPSHIVLAAEASIASLVVIMALPHSVVLLPYLVVLPLLTGLARGLSGASWVVGGQLTVIITATATNSGLSGLEARMELLAPWTLTIVVAGMLGASARKLGKSPGGTSMDEKYDAARRLLGQLRTLARRLSSGLEPVTIASQMLVMTEERRGRGQSAILTKNDAGIFAPLAHRGAGASEVLDHSSELVAETWRTASATSKFVASPGSAGAHLMVLPLRLGNEMVGVLMSRADNETPNESLASLQQDLDEMSLRLATALAFDEVRSLVTEDERQRLAREIHDGVAQEVASLGYVVDELADMTKDPDVSTGLKELRCELSRVVSDLRLSIFELRTEVGDGPGLGSAISDYVRKVGARSSMTVHLTLDEAPSRLSPGVETELFRMAQEAITNARKHSQAENLWVNCTVRPPAATITVRDDGCGVGRGRVDSYGLRIMQERAERVGAGVFLEQLHETPGRPGTCVTITLGANELPMVKQVEVAS